MSQAKFLVMQGYGTERNPFVYGSERLCVDGKIGANENVRAVIVSDFDPEPDGGRRLGSDVLPVVPLEYTNNLTGRLLTIIDATFSDPEQRKAMKDLFSQSLWSWYSGNIDSLSEYLREAEKKDQSVNQ